MQEESTNRPSSGVEGAAGLGELGRPPDRQELLSAQAEALNRPSMFDEHAAARARKDPSMTKKC